MSYLLDTGIWLRAFDASAVSHGVILRCIDALWQRQVPLFVTVQNLAEFWNVSTRPKANNGLGLSISEVSPQLAMIESIATVLWESDRSVAHWKRIVADHAVIGAKVHDARLVAVMLAAGIPRMLTLNVRDFQRYPGVAAVAPETLLVGGDAPRA